MIQADRRAAHGFPFPRILIGTQDSGSRSADFCFCSELTTQPEQLLLLSTKVVKDLKEWTETVSARFFSN